MHYVIITLACYYYNHFFYLVKRNIMKYQNVITGLYPSNSAEKNVGSIRDTLYCSMATWALRQAYKKIDNDQGKSYELAGSTIKALQGILSCWMRQCDRLENFKIKQCPEHALHVKFDLSTGLAIGKKKDALRK